jgi:sec-independent protein translocase protein TatC
VADNEDNEFRFITRSAERLRENPEALTAFLESLRRSLIRIAVAVLGCSVVGYLFAQPILKSFHSIVGAELAAYGVPEAFFALLNVAFAVGVFVSIPLIIYEILAAIAAAFPSFSRRAVVGFWCMSVFLFYAGALFCRYITLPYGVKFLLSFEGENVEAIISVRKFVSFCMLFLFGFGLIFELPLAMILVSRLGLASAKTLGRARRWAILVISIVAAVLTPTPDVFNMMLMAVPLYVLFEIGLLGMRLWGKKPGELSSGAESAG